MGPSLFAPLRSKDVVLDRQVPLAAMSSGRCGVKMQIHILRIALQCLVEQPLRGVIVSGLPRRQRLRLDVEDTGLAWTFALFER